MSTNHNNICMKAEAAIAAYLATKTLGTIPAANIFTGMSRGINASSTASEEASNPLPNVTIFADGGDEAIHMTGIFSVNVNIEVNSNADDTTLDIHREDAGAVFDELLTDSLPEDLNGDYFTVLGVSYGSQGSGIAGRLFKSSFSLTLQCCGSDVT